MRILPASFQILFTLCLFLFSCKEEKEDLDVETVHDYTPLAKGKFIIYRLDSLLFPQAGRAEETRTYREKHIVDTLITDNLNRPSYRVFRYLSDSTGSQPWRPSGSYLVTALPNSLEVTEENMRVIRLVAPVREGAAWKGNRFLSAEPYAAKFNFSNDDAMGEWEFTIPSVRESLVLNGKLVPNVVTVTSVDEALNAPVTDRNAYGARTLYIEKFAKGLGSVYQEFVMWEYQPNPGSSPYKVGFGVKRTMIDHN